MFKTSDSIVTGCTAAILSFNSDATIEAAIHSVQDFDEVIICDGGSTDNTRSIATNLGCRLLNQPLEFKDSNNRLLDIGGVREHILKEAANDWVFFLDSDELGTENLRLAIYNLISQEEPPGAAAIPRLFVVDGQTIECAMTYPSYQRRLVRRDAVETYRGSQHDVPVLFAGEEVVNLEEPQLVPMPPLRELWTRWAAYRRREELKHLDLSISEWATRVARPRMRKVWWLAYRLARCRVRCTGTQLPLRYELGRLANDSLYVWYTGRRFLGFRPGAHEDIWR